MKPNKRVLGITGTIASGKSTVSRYLEQRHHIPRIDADRVGHAVLEEKKEELMAAFGKEILEEGKVSRPRLGAIVFADPAKLQQLNQIMHPAICAHIEAWIRETQAPILAVEAIELLRSEIKDMVDEIWVVYADPEIRMKRMMQERGLSEEEARKRVQSQWDDAQYRKAADCVICGNGTLEDLYRQCDQKVNDE
ncbi:MAG: dephospho-CoA kinase [Lachnospiraceae bacterium]|jgi:dephospho-CoA kinase|nr:dephospho-CoA kinase [Lachnospiraceae bacterium]